MSFVSSPFLIVAARAAFASLDKGMLDVAATLGHADASRFLRVAVPSAGHGIRAGMLLTWLRAFGEYGACRDPGVQPRVVADLHGKPIQWSGSAYDVGSDGAGARSRGRRRVAQSRSNYQTGDSTLEYTQAQRAREGVAAARPL